MKRTYLIIGSLLLSIVILAFGVSQWNTKLATTAEDAKKELAVAAKENEASAADVEGSMKENGSNTSSGNLGSDAVTGPTSIDSGSKGSGSTTSEAAKEQNGSSPSENSASNDNSNGSTSSSSSKNSDTSTSSTSQSVAEIKAAYQTVFNDFEAQETSKIDQLMVQAKADYVSNKLSKAEMAVKYQEAAATLESNADKTFNAIYGQLQNDLEKNGHSADEAAEFKSNYQTEKQQRSSRVMNQVQNL